MLSISHSLTGAFIATKIPQPYISIPLIFASHYLEDWIPHWDVGTGLSNGKRKKSTAVVLELGELAATIGLIYFYWQQGSAEFNSQAWFGAFVGLVPDFLEAPNNFLNIHPKITKPLNDLHGYFHGSIPNIFWGLLPQVVIWGLIWILR